MKDYKHIEHMRNLNDSLIWERMKRCYDYGYEDGQKEKLANAMIYDHEVAEKKAYERGLNDAWEVARKLVHPRLGGYTEEQKQRIFGEYVSSDSILQNFTAPEAIAKIKAYEDKQKCKECKKTKDPIFYGHCVGECDYAKQTEDEIKVGDEVTHDGAKFIVLNIDSQTSVYCLDTRGRTPIFTNIHNLTKTGRHFDEIEKVLEQMKKKDNE